METFRRSRFQLVASVVALVMSLFMLTGNTIAWFTDVKTSEENIIQFGELEAGLRSMLGISAHVVLVAPKTIARSEGKAVRVIDKRKI